MYALGDYYLSDAVQEHSRHIYGYGLKRALASRLSYESCTLENVLADNAQILELAKKHSVNHILIDDKYEVDINI